MGNHFETLSLDVVTILVLLMPEVTSFLNRGWSSGGVSWSGLKKRQNLAPKQLNVSNASVLDLHCIVQVGLIQENTVWVKITHHLVPPGTSTVSWRKVPPPCVDFLALYTISPEFLLCHRNLSTRGHQLTTIVNMKRNKLLLHPNLASGGVAPLLVMRKNAGSLGFTFQMWKSLSILYWLW